MNKFGELLKNARKKKRITTNRASNDLLIKREHLEALENEDWNALPENAYVLGYIKTYSQYLGLDKDYVLAIYRREFDERKISPKTKTYEKKRRFFVTPARLVNLIFMGSAMVFVLYIIIIYSQVLSSPKLDIYTPEDDLTTSTPIIKITGKVEEASTVSLNGQFIPVDEYGNFSYEFMLKEGKNDLEVIASKRLSPKSKQNLTIRLIN